MGREASITPEQVSAVADMLRAEGLTPTLRAVRERLGGGSMGTISRLLTQWKARQQPGAPVASSLPPALQRALLEFLSAEMAAARAPLEAEIAELQQAHADLALDNERQAQRHQDLQAELDALWAQKAVAEARAVQLAQDLEALRLDAVREREDGEAARTELAKATLRLEVSAKLEADLARSTAELAHERSARVAAEQSAAVLAAQQALSAEHAAHQATLLRDTQARLAHLMDQVLGAAGSDSAAGVGARTKPAR